MDKLNIFLPANYAMPAFPS